MFTVFLVFAALDIRHALEVRNFWCSPCSWSYCACGDYRAIGATVFMVFIMLLVILCLWCSSCFWCCYAFDARCAIGATCYWCSPCSWSYCACGVHRAFGVVMLLMFAMFLVVSFLVFIVLLCS